MKAGSSNKKHKIITVAKFGGIRFYSLGEMALSAYPPQNLAF